jgi:hypothetical protein
MRFDPTWKEITQVRRSWDVMRWITLEPSWMVAKALMSGGWKWHSPEACKIQGGLLLRRIEKVIEQKRGNPVRAAARTLVMSYQGMFCLMDIFNTWGITESKTKGPMGQKIIDSEGYQILLGVFDLLNDDIDTLQDGGAMLTEGMYTSDEMILDWGAQTLEARTMIVREFFRKLGAVCLKVHNRWPKAEADEVILAASKWHPEITKALEDLHPEALNNFFEKGLWRAYGNR